MITSLALKNFKNFRDARLSLGGLTLLVGANATGKSNLRDAFRFIHGLSRGYLLSEIVGEKYVEGGVLQWKGIRGGMRETAFHGERQFSLKTGVRISQRFRVPALHSICVDVGDAKEPPRIVAEECGRSLNRPWYSSRFPADPPAQEGPPYLFVRLPRDERNRKHGKRLRFLDNQPVLSQFSTHRNVKPELAKFTDAVIKRLASMRFLDLSPDAMRMPSFPGQIILGDRGENLSSVLQAIVADESKKRSLLAWICELTPLDVTDFEFVPDQTGRVLLTLVEADGRRTSAYSASDGTLRFLAIVAAMLGPDPARFYFFEEIDTGIHPTRLHLLLQLIEQTVAQERIQVVATTHSPQLLAFLSPESLQHAALVYRLREASDARIERIATLPDALRLLKERNLGRLLESGWLENAVEFGASMEPPNAA